MQCRRENLAIRRISGNPVWRERHFQYALIRAGVARFDLMRKTVVKKVSNIYKTTCDKTTNQSRHLSCSRDLRPRMYVKRDVVC